VKTILRLERRASYADYLAVEQNSHHRHELIDGVIVAMAGGSDEHNAIAGRFAGLFMARVEGGECRYYTPDQRFWIPANARSRYADGSVICGKPKHPPHDDQATTNPAVILEVLSPSSEGDDEGDKRLDFQSLDSLQAYVVASQDELCVKVYRRDDRGAWRPAPDVYTRGQAFPVPTLSRACAVDEVYDTVLDESGRSLLR
jgi:Uma2 family endonuclease